MHRIFREDSNLLARTARRLGLAFGDPVEATLLTADRARISGCDDLDVLDVWFNRAVTAVSVEEVFAEFTVSQPRPDAERSAGLTAEA